ncbi:hypothetical protein G6F33_013043 [Rhizopus arrhizus]|nr:hypothetical protein G6F33_013043 [Rhizopus arrhizus]
MSNDAQTPTLQEQMALLQQQLQQQQQQQQQSPAHQPQPMQDIGDNSLPPPRAKYEWTPSNELPHRSLPTHCCFGLSPT